jgi:hypothetical protein
MPQPKSSPKKSSRAGPPSVPAAWNGPFRITPCKKKLFHRPLPLPPVPTQRTTTRTQLEPADPASLERQVRQLLADKVSGNLVGLWLLIPEHLRLGTWDLLCGWTGHGTARPEPRLALQLIHEAALCTTGVREKRALSQNGFELVNGLPWLATDGAIHALLSARTVAQTQRLQVALGKLRRTLGHFAGRVLAIDPHRPRSYTKRQTRRWRGDQHSRPIKVSPTFFVLDGDTHQPVCFTTATAARLVTTASIELLGLAAEILDPQPEQALVVADAEHFTAKLLDHLQRQTHFDLLVPMGSQKLDTLTGESFTPHWAGYATLTRPYQPRRSQAGPFWQLVQRFGERADDYWYKAFVATTHRDVVRMLCEEFPKRWHLEEFYNADQALGWQRAGTQNLNIRYGQMTMALIAQAVLHQFRKHLGEPYRDWDASHLAEAVFRGIEGDIRVYEDTILVTYYNAPHTDLLRPHYEGLPRQLEAEGIDPRIPWLYNFKLDFRFK